jgi:hypothetical protein
VPRYQFYFGKVPRYQFSFGKVPRYQFSFRKVPWLPIFFSVKCSGYQSNSKLSWHQRRSLKNSGKEYFPARYRSPFVHSVI